MMKLALKFLPLSLLPLGVFFYQNPSLQQVSSTATSPLETPADFSLVPQTSTSSEDETTPRPLRAQASAFPKKTAGPLLALPGEKTSETPAQALQRRWDLSGTDLNAQELADTFKDSEPEKIYYYQGSRMHALSPETTQFGAGGIQFLADEQAVKKIQEQRRNETQNRDAIIGKGSGPGVGSLGGSSQGAFDNTKLAQNHYTVFQFLPGTRDQKDLTIHVPDDILSPVMKQDYQQSLTEDEARKTVLSFGHGGEMTLEIRDDAVLKNKEGFDFVIYENVFRYASGKLWQEFAQVGVATKEQPNTFYWFPCEPTKGILKGCAGVVPNEEGGDEFDLAELNVDNVRFIKIRDFGNNYNIGPNKEGFDLDAGRFLNVYKD